MQRAEIQAGDRLAVLQQPYFGMVAKGRLKQRAAADYPGTSIEVIAHAGIAVDDGVRLHRVVADDERAAAGVNHPGAGGRRRQGQITEAGGTRYARQPSAGGRRGEVEDRILAEGRGARQQDRIVHEQPGVGANVQGGGAVDLAAGAGEGRLSAVHQRDGAGTAATIDGVGSGEKVGGIAEGRRSVDSSEPVRSIVPIAAGGPTPSEIGHDGSPLLSGTLVLASWRTVYKTGRLRRRPAALWPVSTGSCDSGSSLQNEKRIIVGRSRS